MTSKKLRYITDDKIDIEQLDIQGYLSDDMSITKEKDKTYSKCENGDCIKNHPCFGYYQLYYLRYLARQILVWIVLFLRRINQLLWQVLVLLILLLELFLP